MADTTVKDRLVLRCECGGELFEAISKLTWMAGGGSATTPAGHRCIACNAIVDNAYMIQLAKLAEKRRELTAMQQEVEAMTPPKPDAAASRH